MERTIDRVALKKEAKRLLDGKVFKMLLCYIIYGVILVGCFALCFLTPNFLSQYFVGALENVLAISTALTTATLQLIVWGLFLFVRVILFVALLHPFSVCIATVPLAVAEGRAITWKEAAAPIRRLRYFIECMITGAAQFLQTFFWSLLLLVPGLLSHYRHFFTKYIFIENNELTFGETAAKSKDLAREFEGQLLFLDLSFLGWLLFGICTGGIGLLYLVCYYSVTKVLYYKEAKKFCGQEADEAPPPCSQAKVMEQPRPTMGHSARTASHEGKGSEPQNHEPNQHGKEAEPVATTGTPGEPERPAPQQEAEPTAEENPTEPERPHAEEERKEAEQEPEDKKPADATLWVDSSDKGIRIARGTMTNLNSNIAQPNDGKQEETT